MANDAVSSPAHEPESSFSPSLTSSSSSSFSSGYSSNQESSLPITNVFVSRGIGFELCGLSSIALCFGIVYFILHRLQIPEDAFERAAPVFSLFVIANVIAAAIAIQGLRWIPTRGLVYEIGFFITMGVTGAALGNSLDLILWLGLGHDLKTNPLPYLIFFVGLSCGAMGMFRLARLLHIRIGPQTLVIFIAILALFALVPLWLTPQMVGPSIFQKGNARDVLAHVFFAAMTAFVAALAIQNGFNARGQLQAGARLVSIGTVLLGAGCMAYAQAASRLPVLAAASSPAHIILDFAYICIGMGVFRLGAKMVEMFSPDLSVLPPSKPLVDLFGKKIGMQVYEGLVKQIKSSEASLSLIRDQSQARAGMISVLEYEVQRRTLVEEELRLAKEKAEAANHAKSQFLAMMSHELRTPLTMVYGYGTMLADSSIREGTTLSVGEMGRRICQSSYHLQSIIEGILDFSSIELGKNSFLKAPFDLRDLITFMKSFEESQNVAKNVTFRCDYADEKSQPHAENPEKNHLVKTDSKLLRQILVNLVGNALKFTTAGEVTLKIRRSPEGVFFHVRDSGPGIPESEQSKVFEPFYQINQANSRNFGGVGLGLTIVKRLAAELGGELSLESHLHQGTCFSLFLPEKTIS
ncbi:MAG: ATP-binding protein [Candidatus Ozemobacteraceae bacterium]